jgi:dihydrofolate reductase
MKFSIVAAVDQKNGLGKNNTLVWRLPSDLKHFSKLTTETSSPGKINAVIMGRKTWQSLPPKSQPLKDRLNIVLSRGGDIAVPESVLLASSLDEALQQSAQNPDIENIYVIGGGKVYQEAINHPDCEKIYLTRINAVFDCDAFFPPIDEEKFKLEDERSLLKENELEFRFLVYERY